MIWLNDNDPTACAVLREMMASGLIAEGTVDGRSIADVPGDGLDRFNRVHLFAGIGGFEIAARLAGWPDGRTLWTGGFPCQPFSAAGRRGGTGDDRYLWPEFHRLLRAGRPEFVLVENVPGIDGAADLVLDRVCADLEGLGYQVWPAEIPACAVDAAHLRNRVWIVAHRAESGFQGSTGSRLQGARNRSAENYLGPVADRVGAGLEGRSGDGSDVGAQRQAAERDGGGAVGDGEGDRYFGAEASPRKVRWRPTKSCVADGTAWIAGHDGKLRRVPLGIIDPAGVLADGLPGRRVALHGLGNAIVPQVAARLMTAMMEAA